MRKPTLSFWLSIGVIALALVWVLFPEQNLEPLIVLILALIGLVPLVRSELIPWLEHLRLKRKKLNYLSGSSKINASESTFSEMFDGTPLELKLVKQGFHQYPVTIRAFFEQTDFRFKAYFDKGLSIELRKFFDVGYEKVDEPPIFPKKTNEYIVAQFDIDGDGVDELILGVIDCEEILRDVQLTIYKYHPSLFTEDLNRLHNWQCLGTLTAYGIVGEVKIELKSRAVCIPRNHRGFYYKWALADNKFVDIGDY